MRRSSSPYMTAVTAKLGGTEDRMRGDRTGCDLPLPLLRKEGRPCRDFATAQY